eukprot:GO255871.1.p1 GENE.GO255871.1~~GO255871.1.p1  ORF type:complete len:188 (+),score=34.05 GO255871.1:20-583(+)
MNAFIATPTLPRSSRRRNAVHYPTCSHRSIPSPTTRRTLLRLLALSPLIPTLPTLSKVTVADPNAGSTITTLPSGLQYFDFVQAPDSPQAVSPGSEVTIRYTLGTTGARNGWRIETAPNPLTFRVGAHDVVLGLEEGVVGMRTGGRRRLLIPEKLGYIKPSDKPVPTGFAEFQRFKNLYLNPTSLTT